MPGNKKGFKIRYVPHVVEEILDRTSNGEHLTQICQLTHMPERNSVYKWLRRYPDFYEQYRIAKECQADTYMDRIIQIAEDCWRDNSIDAGNARVAMDCYKFVMSKLYPKKYNDKIMAIDAAAENATLPPVINVSLPAPYDLKPQVIEHEPKRDTH